MSIIEQGPDTPNQFLPTEEPELSKRVRNYVQAWSETAQAIIAHFENLGNLPTEEMALLKTLLELKSPKEQLFQLPAAITAQIRNHHQFQTKLIKILSQVSNDLKAKDVLFEFSEVEKQTMRSIEFRLRRLLGLKIDHQQT